MPYQNHSEVSSAISKWSYNTLEYKSLAGPPFSAWMDKNHSWHQYGQKTSNKSNVIEVHLLQMCVITCQCFAIDGWWEHGTALFPSQKKKTISSTNQQWCPKTLEIMAPPLQILPNHLQIFAKGSTSSPRLILKNQKTTQNSLPSSGQEQ